MWLCSPDSQRAETLTCFSFRQERANQTSTMWKPELLKNRLLLKLKSNVVLNAVCRSILTTFPREVCFRCRMQASHHSHRRQTWSSQMLHLTVLEDVDHLSSELCSFSCIPGLTCICGEFRPSSVEGSWGLQTAAASLWIRAFEAVTVLNFSTRWQRWVLNKLMMTLKWVIIQHNHISVLNPSLCLRATTRRETLLTISRD